MSDQSNLSVLLSFIFVIGLLVGAYLLTRRLGRTGLGSRQSKYIKSIDRFALTRDKWIEIIQVGDQALVLGISGNSIQVLTSIKLSELNELPQTQPAESFRSMFEKLLRREERDT